MVNIVNFDGNVWFRLLLLRLVHATMIFFPGMFLLVAAVNGLLQQNDGVLRRDLRL